MPYSYLEINNQNHNGDGGFANAQGLLPTEPEDGSCSSKNRSKVDYKENKQFNSCPISF